jgi:hypothetical protein
MFSNTVLSLGLRGNMKEMNEQFTKGALIEELKPLEVAWCGNA